MWSALYVTQLLGGASFVVAQTAAYLQPAAKLPDLSWARMFKLLLWDICAQGLVIGPFFVWLLYTIATSGGGAAVAVAGGRFTLSHSGWQLLAALVLLDGWYYLLHRYAYHQQVQKYRLSSHTVRRRRAETELTFINDGSYSSFGARSRLIQFLKHEHQSHHAIEALDFWRGNQGSLLDLGVISFAVPIAILSLLLRLDLGGAMFVYEIMMIIQVNW